MLLKSENQKNLRTIDRLLRTQAHAELEAFVHERFNQDLLSDELLAAARAMRLTPVVLFLATLGVHNLSEPNDRAAWLAIYQSLSSKQFSPELAQSPEYNPLRQVVNAIFKIEKNPGYVPEFLYKKKYDDHWVAACQLAFDLQHFKIVNQIFTHFLKNTKRWEATHWMKVVKIIFERLPEYKNVDGIAAYHEINKIYATTYNQLPADNQYNEARTWLALWATDSSWKAQNFNQAIEWSEKTKNTYYELSASTIIASVYAFQGELEKSKKTLDQIIIALQDKTELIEYIGRYRLENPQDSSLENYDINSARQALLDLQSILKPYEITPFLISGTLLGYAREGGILKHDKDIDIGILNWQDQYGIVLAALESGLFSVSTQSINNEKTYFIGLKHYQTGQCIDICFFHNQNDKFITGLHSNFGNNPKFIYSVFGLKEIDFLGVKFHIPDNLDQHLTENYGDWRTPDPNYLFIEAPSIDKSDILDYQLSCRLFFLDTLQKNNLPKIKRAIKTLESIKNKPHGITDEILSALNKIYFLVQEIQDEGIS